MIRSSSLKFDPPEKRTFSQGGRCGPLGGGAGLSGSMLKGEAIAQTQLILRI
jgi:hypothetical protein